ncbi:MAG: flagellar basal body rod protein FlgC [candidate division FCPU426 bacterium]
MNLFSSFEISGSGLSAQRLRMDTVANNIANVNTTRTAEGGPYRRLRVVFEPRQSEPLFLLPLEPKERAMAQLSQGVRVTGVSPDPAGAKMVYDPGHPDADAKGYVAMPNINIVNEMVDMISASRAYEANVTAINDAKSMALKALEIGKA